MKTAPRPGLPLFRGETLFAVLERARKSSRHFMVLLLTTGLALLAECCLAAPASLSEGQRLAEGLCARCHAVAPSRPNSWTDAPTFESIANRPGMTREWLVQFIPKPHGHMSAWNYTPAQVDSIATYILSLRRR
jgi:cytochrome c